MFGLNFSKLPRNRQFDYQPIFYDPDKEELDERVNRIKREMGMAVEKEESLEERMRSAFKSKHRSIRYRKNLSQKLYPLKISMIAGFLGYVVYKFLKSDILETIFGI